MRGTAVSRGTRKKVFVECFAETAEGPCYEALGITDDPYISDKDAAEHARARGWIVSGFYGAKRTRCPDHRHVRKSADAQELVSDIWKPRY